MTPSEWRNLKLGTYLLYINSGAYQNTLCEVIGIYPTVGLKIIKPGDSQCRYWRNLSAIANNWNISEAYKFKSVSAPQTLEDRITQKIKALDLQWAQTQAKKGNKYAVLCL